MPCRTSRRQGAAEAGGEPEAADGRGDRVLLGPGAHVDAHQRLGPLQGGGLGEVHDVDRRLVGGEQFLDRLVQRRHRVREEQRDRPLGVADHGGRPAGAPAQVVDEAGGVAQRGRHQEELRLRQLDERHLPGPAAVRLGVEVELVHHDLADVGVGALAQRQVGQDLGGAADDRGVRVDAGVAGEHADVLRAEDRAQGEELLADQRLDRRGVEGGALVGQGGEVRAGGDQALARAGRGVEDDVRPGGDLDERLLLMRCRASGPARSPSSGRRRRRRRVRRCRAGVR